MVVKFGLKQQKLSKIAPISYFTGLQLEHMSSEKTSDSPNDF